jgi:hypothetical protein
MRNISVRFQWFWQDFVPNQNFLVDFLESEGYKVEIITDRKAKVNIEFVSVFPPFKRKVNEKIQRWRKTEVIGFGDVAEKYILEKYPDTSNFDKRIWLTGENLRPPLMQNYDSFLSYDQDSFGGRNAYLPIWYFDIDFFGRKVQNRTGTNINLDQLTSSRQINELGKNFAVSFIGNPHPIRMQAIRAFQEIKDVELYGSAVNRPVVTKIEVAKNSIFSFCFENDLYPGYVTEKIIEAFACGNIPLYWGLFGGDSVFNKLSYLNLADFETLHHYRDYVLTLKKSELLAIANEPLLFRKPDLSQIFKVITGKVPNQYIPG